MYYVVNCVYGNEHVGVVDNGAGNDGIYGGLIGTVLGYSFHFVCGIPYYLYHLCDQQVSLVLLEIGSKDGYCMIIVDAGGLASCDDS